MIAPRKRGGQLGNTNAKCNGPHRVALSVSVSGERLEIFLTHLVHELGHEPNEEERNTKLRALFLEAIDAYLSS